MFRSAKQVLAKSLLGTDARKQFLNRLYSRNSAGAMIGNTLIFVKTRIGVCPSPFSSYSTRRLVIVLDNPPFPGMHGTVSIMRRASAGASLRAELSARKERARDAHSRYQSDPKSTEPVFLGEVYLGPT